MTAKETTQNKTAVLFKRLAQKAFDFRGVKVTAESCFDEMIAFTKLHNHFLTMPNVNEKAKEQMKDRYPFLKINNRWVVSVPKLYLYLVVARGAIGTFEDSNMVDVYVMIRQAMRYLDDVKKLDIKLTPKKHWDYESYTKMQAELYEQYMTAQLPLFE